MLDEVEIAVAEVDLRGDVDGFESVPLSVGDEGGKGESEGKFRAKLKGATESEKENQKVDDGAGEIDGVVFDAVEEIEAEVKRLDIAQEDKYGVGGNDSERKSDDLERSEAEERKADGADEGEKIETEGVAVGAGVVAFVIELVEYEREDSLEAKKDNGVAGEVVIDGGIHVHEIDVVIDVIGDETEYNNTKNNADTHARHDGVFVAVADFTNVGASREW